MKDALEKLAADWRKRAYGAVPEAWAGRDLHSKYLKCDNHAAGLDDAAFELEELLRAQPEENKVGCRDCGGSGRQFGYACPACYGTGWQIAETQSSEEEE